MDSTTPATVDKTLPPPLLIQDRAELSTYITGCQHAQTLIAYSPEHSGYLLIPLTCKQWSCRACANDKIRQLSWKTREARPNRMLTLTVDPNLWEGRREAFDGTRRHIPTLISFLRKKFGEVEYLRVTELTKNGWPHYHMLIRSGFLPHKVIKNRWEELTGARIVDIRPVKQSWSAYTYLVKYLSKLHRIEWTERHVAYSRGFFPPESEDKPTGFSLERPGVHPCHPVSYCLEYEKGSTLQPVSKRAFKIIPRDFQPQVF